MKSDGLLLAVDRSLGLSRRCRGLLVTLLNDVKELSMSNLSSVETRSMTTMKKRKKNKNQNGLISS